MLDIGWIREIMVVELGKGRNVSGGNRGCHGMCEPVWSRGGSVIQVILAMNDALSDLEIAVGPDMISHAYLGVPIYFPPARLIDSIH